MAISANNWREKLEAQGFGKDALDQVELAMHRWMERARGMPVSANEVLNVVLSAVDGARGLGTSVKEVA